MPSLNSHFYKWVGNSLTCYGLSEITLVGVSPAQPRALLDTPGVQAASCEHIHGSTPPPHGSRLTKADVLRGYLDLTGLVWLLASERRWLWSKGDAVGWEVWAVSAGLWERLLWRVIAYPEEMK